MCFETGKYCSRCHESQIAGYYTSYYSAYYADYFGNYYAEYYFNAMKEIDKFRDPDIWAKKEGSL